MGGSTPRHDIPFGVVLQHIQVRYQKAAGWSKPAREIGNLDDASLVPHVQDTIVLDQSGWKKHYFIQANAQMSSKL